MRGKTATACALAVALAVSAGSAEEKTLDWPRWRGARFDGSAAHGEGFPEPLTLFLHWRRTLGSGYSGVVVAEGSAVTLFSDGTDDYVAALDAETGVERWRTRIAPTNRGREGARNGPVSTPAIDDGAVFALGPRGNLLALRLASGTILWHVDLVKELGAAAPHWGFGTSPLVYDDVVIVAGGGAEGGPVTAFDRETGKVRWSAGRDELNYQSPMLAGSPARVIVAGDRTLSSLDPGTGRELWSFEHGGQDFYRRILNPVEVASDSFLITYRPGEALLFRVDGKKVVPRWSTRHLKLNYATPVLHGDYLYGYSSRFLACVDARSGELVWKSRAPGDGFPIVVDGHLVVATKQGGLHVAEATPSGYREKASLEVFANLVWTPPSFAFGRVFARDSYGDVASVGVAASGPTMASDAPSSEVPGRIPESRFARWVRDVEAAADKGPRIARWLSEQTSFPVVEDDRFVHFVFEGEADDVAIAGDLTEAGRELPMHRIEGTRFFYASLALEADARINYQLVRNMEERIADPRNPRRAPSLLNRGETSQLLMPRAERPEAPSGTPATGTLESFVLESEPVRVGAKTWGGKRRVHVYLPPDYGIHEAVRYPSMYVLYGEQMLRGAGIRELLDASIGSRIEPVITVFVESISPYEYARSQREAHAAMIVDRLVPHIDGLYRTRRDARHRVVAGVDEGAYAALALALEKPDVFEGVAAQSVLPVGDGDEILLRKIQSGGDGLVVYLDWGRRDQRNPADGVDVPGYGRRLRDALRSAGHDVSGREWNDGSDLAIWGMRFGDVLESFFRLAHK